MEIPVQVQEEIVDLMALTLIPGVGPVKARKILAHAGSAKHFAKEYGKLKIRGIRQTRELAACYLDARRRAENELQKISKENIRVVSIRDSEYPERLRNCDDAPLLLYVRGQMNLNPERIVAVVGTRKASAYGQNITGQIVEELAKHNCTVVSGLAYGIDTCAHKAADRLGIQNIGVLAHGLDRIYPRENLSLSRKMERNGGLVTDFVTGTLPDRENFPSRNRIVAGMADAIVVVEAAESGGALITAEIALGYNREVFAVPGRLGDEYSLGCNRLIKQNKAALLSKPEDIAWYLGWDSERKNRAPQQTTLFPELNPDEKIILDQLKINESVDLDTISIQSGLSVSSTSATLLSLEFKGAIRSLPGKRYQRL